MDGEAERKKGEGKGGGVTVLRMNCHKTNLNLKESLDRV